MALMLECDLIDLCQDNFASLSQLHCAQNSVIAKKTHRRKKHRPWVGPVWIPKKEKFQDWNRSM